MRKGYQDAIYLAEQQLNTLDPVTVCARTGAAWDGETYIIPWFGEGQKLSSGSDTERVLWLHYLISQGTRAPSGSWMAYRELPGAAFYEPKFIARTVRPLVNKFGRGPEALIKAAKPLNGEPVPLGDFGVVLPVLPFVPVAYVLWAGDEELPPEGNILFDRTASGWLSTEDLTVLAAQGTYRLITYIT